MGTAAFIRAREVIARHVLLLALLVVLSQFALVQICNNTKAIVEIGEASVANIVAIFLFSCCSISGAMSRAVSEVQSCEALLPFHRFTMSFSRGSIGYASIPAPYLPPLPHLSTPPPHAFPRLPSPPPPRHQILLQLRLSHLHSPIFARPPAAESIPEVAMLPSLTKASTGSC